MTSANYGIQGPVTARNVAVGEGATIQEIGLGQEIEALKVLISELPAEERKRAQAAVSTLERADKSTAEGRTSIRSALAEVEAAAKSSVGIADAAQKIVNLVAPLTALFL